LSPNPAKARWQLEDLRLWSEMWGIGLKIHEKWPFDSKICAVAWLLASREAPPIAVALDLFRAHFVEGRDTRRPDVLTDIAVAHGLDPEVFAAGLADESVHERVAGYTQELIRRGGFGTPSMFLGDELFFGNDRVALLEWRLGPISDAEFVAPGQHGPDAA
jgi:2-hydroxychromene-2-carboxylate isomerase